MGRKCMDWVLNICVNAHLGTGPGQISVLDTHVNTGGLAYKY